MPVPILSDEQLQSALIVGLAKLNQDLKAVLFQLPDDKKDPVRRVVQECFSESHRLYGLVCEWGIDRVRGHLSAREQQS